MPTTKTTGRRSSTSRRRRRKFPSIGPFVIDWMRRNLVHAEGERQGEPFDPDPWFIDTINRAYRFDPSTCRRIVDRVLVMIGSGNAKTEYGGAWALAELAGPVVAHPGVMHGQMPWPRKSPTIPIAAASYDQANLLFGAAKMMVDEGPLAPFVDSFEHELALKDRPGRLYRIAAVASTNDGQIPSAFFADELHEWTGRKRRLHTVMRAKLRKRASLADVLEVNLSTAGDPATSDLLLSLYEYGRKIITGELVDDAFLPVIFEPGNSERLMKRLTAGKATDSEIVKAIREANPARWLNPDAIARDLRTGEIPLHEWLRLHGNMWVHLGVTWDVASVWDQVPVDSTPLEPGTRVCLAFDGSYNGDSTALWAATIDDAPRLHRIGLWERPENAKTWKVPRGEVLAALEETFRVFDVVELACDPAKWPTEIDSWIDRWGDDRVIEYPQSNQRMVPATKKFRDAVYASIPTEIDPDPAPVIYTDGDAALARHIGNARVKTVAERAYVIVKIHPNQKIDAAIAAVMVYDRATVRRDLDAGLTPMVAVT